MSYGRRNVIPIFRSAFKSPSDEHDPNLGIRPVVFDILAPDRETSILPESLKLVLHVNPTSMSFSYSKVIERIQTKGGYVEQHWGDAPTTISLSMVTGGFMRLYTGLSNITGGGQDMGGNRRQTIAYDKYLDMLALFKNNGAVYDTTGKIVFHGSLKMTFDGGIYLGWFSSFGVTENAEKPYMFDLSAEFVVSKEILRLRSLSGASPMFMPTTVNMDSTPVAMGLPPKADTLVLPASEAAAAAGALGGTGRDVGSAVGLHLSVPAPPTTVEAASTPPSALVSSPVSSPVWDLDGDGLLDTYEGTTSGWRTPETDLEMALDGDGILDTYAGET